MSRLRKTVAAISLGALLSVSLASRVSADTKAPKAGPMVDCLTLCQVSEFGPMVMRISHDAMRMEIDKMSINWIAKAPKWSSVAFNPESKMIVTRDYADWKENLIRMPGNNAKKKTTMDFKLKPTGESETVAGYKCRKVAFYKPTIDGPQVHAHPGGSGKGPKPVKPYPMGFVWISDDFPAPKQVTEVMKQLTRVDVDRGMVLKATILKPNSYKDYKPAFETLSVKKEKVSSNIFDAPTGYKTVSSEFDLMMGGGEDDTFAPEIQSKMPIKPPPGRH